MVVEEGVTKYKATAVKEGPVFYWGNQMFNNKTKRIKLVFILIIILWPLFFSTFLKQKNFIRVTLFYY